MPYTDDPANIPDDQVRFYVGDTSTTAPDLTDNQVAFLLLEEGGNPLRAAARAAEVLAAKYAKTASEKRVGPLAIIQGTRSQSKAQEFSKLAKRLWARAGAGSTVPYAGGTSILDKNSNVLDGDRVQPSFSRRMMRYPEGDAHTNSAERLSPPEVLP